MRENAGHGRTGIGIQHQDYPDDRKGPSDRTARGFEEQDDQDRPHGDVDRQRIADPECQLAAWAKPGVTIWCGEHNDAEIMLEQISTPV